MIPQICTSVSGPSIPDSVTHIISKTLRPMSFVFEENNKKLAQFITKHSNLHTWYIHRYAEYMEEDYTAPLLKSCCNIGISFWKGGCPKDLVPPLDLFRGKDIASQVLVHPEFWTEETQRNKLESISIRDPSRKELSHDFHGSPQSFHCQLRNFLLGYYTSWTLECSGSEGPHPSRA